MNSNMHQAYENEIKVLSSVSLKGYESKFNYLNVDEKQEHWILVCTTKAEVLQISILNDQRKLYQIENSQNRQIVDFDIHQDYISVLYDKNEIQVFSLSTEKCVFKAIFKEATDLVSGIFYVPSFDLQDED